jgi:hypothetical protein
METAAVAESMRRFVQSTTGRAPLYARLASGLAEQPAVLAILAAAPATHRSPVGLFAAVHDRLLAEPDQELAAWYPNLTEGPRTDDPVPAFVAFCRAHHRELSELVADRIPQTNEIGRSALLLVGLADIAARSGALAHLDVGASAGLNLLIEHYGYDYSGHRLGGDRLVLECEVKGGPGGLPDAIPGFATHQGLDAQPVDLTDPEQVRWLEACVWPDQTDRFERLRTAIEIGREQEVRVRRGDAVADLADALDGLGEDGHPVVTTSWVLAYLSDRHRADFVAALDARGQQQDLSWVYLEAPAYAPGLPRPSRTDDPELTALTVVEWRGGRRSVRQLATCHPHGYSLRWTPERAVS